jgi:hypothetical protein
VITRRGLVTGSGAAGLWALAPAVADVALPLKSRPDLRDWDGIDYAGRNDSASVVQRAFDASSREGFELQVPAFLCDAEQGIVLDSTITCPGAPRVRGAGRFQQEARNGSNPGLSGSTGTVFKITHAGLGFDVSRRAGAQFRDFTTRRIQPEPTSTGFTANDNDWDFKLSGADHQLQRIHLMNPTNGIVSWDGGRHILEDITGDPLRQGYLCRAQTDVLKINRMHFWAFWRDGAYIMNWLLNNLVAFHFKRCDNGFVDDLFCIAAAWGFQVDDLTGATENDGANNGATNKLKVGKIDMDLCRNAILINSAAGCVVDFGLCSTQGYLDEMNLFYKPRPPVPWPPAKGPHSAILGTNSQIHFDSYYHGNAYLSGLYVGGSKNQVTVGHGHGRSWDVAGGGSPGFAVDTSKGSSLNVVTAINSGSPSSGTPLLGPGVKTATFN